MELCREVAEKSTSTEVLGVVLGALNIINSWHPAFLERGKQKEQLAEVARIVGARDDWKLKNGAADILGALDGKYAKETEQHYAAILRSSTPAGESDPKKRDEAYQHAIRQLIKFKRKEAYPLIRDVTTRFELLDSLRSWIAEDPAKRKTWMKNEEFVREWERLMGEGR